MSNYSNGRRDEHAVRHHLEAQGWVVFRAAGSKGIADLIGFRPGEVAFVQVKRNGVISPADRKQLIALADLVGVDGLPIVAAKPPRQGISFRLLTGPGPKDYVTWEAVSVDA